jgi:peptidyl-prolyl cis-trans isomerase D
MAFVLTDLFSAKAGGGQQGPMNLAEVNGTNISPTEFDMRLQQAYENYQLNTESEEPLDEQTKNQIREQVWNDLLSEVILGKQMQELGVEVTSKELFDMVQGNDPHPQVLQAFRNPETNQFDPNAVVQFLQNLNNDPEMKERWVTFEKALKKQQRRDKFQNLIKKGIYLPSNLAKMQYANNNQVVSFKYVYKPYNAISDTSIQLTDAEVQSYYEEHKEEYKQESGRKILYAYFPVNPSQEDIAATQKYMDESYERFENTENDSIFVNANSDQPFDPTFYSKENMPMGADTSFWSKEVGYMNGPYELDGTYFIQKLKAIKMAPDSVKASHILINNQDRSPERANEIADSLIALLESGTPMSDLALDNSDDVGSAQNGGDLGWFTEGMMVKPFNDAAFSAEVGEFSKVESQFGIHIIEVSDKTAPKKKIQLATIQREVLAGNDTYAEVFNKANSFSIEANDIESFNELVKEKNIQRRSAEITENSTQVRGLPNSREVVRWAIEAKEGKISEAFDVGDAFVVAIVERVDEKGVAPLDKIKNRIEYLAKQDKKAEQFIQEMSGFQNINELASNQRLTIETASGVTFESPTVPGVGMEPKVVGKAFSLEKGQMSVPIQGNSGVFVVSIDSKSDVGEPNLASTRSSVARSIDSRVTNGAVFSALKEKAEITDNRNKFY